MNTPQESTHIATRSRRGVVVQVVGLLVAAAALAARWALGQVTTPVPPGLVILLVAAGLVLALRRPAGILIGIAAAASMAFQVWADADPAVLQGAKGALVATVVWVELAGTLTALFAGIVALVLRQQRLHRLNGTGWDWGQLAQVAGLLVLAPVCAEYLSAYDDSTGRPGQLLGNLLIFIPLYGFPALLIREAARRWGLGWRGIILLAGAFALIQAGLVDQSLFSVDYRQIDGWEQSYQATLIPPLGVSAYNVLNFVGGHIVFSISAPIALVEAARPVSARSPWLSQRGLAAVAAGYVGASALVLYVTLTTESSHASLPQLVVTSVFVLALVAAAVLARHRHQPPLGRRAPGLRLTSVAALAVALLHVFGPETWTGTAMAAAAFVLAGLGLGWVSRMTGWSAAHIAVVAAAPLIVRAVLAFSYDPLVGEVSESAKYGHNAVMLAVVLLAVVLALRPVRGHVPQDTDPAARGQLPVRPSK